MSIVRPSRAAPEPTGPVLVVFKQFLFKRRATARLGHSKLSFQLRRQAQDHQRCLQVIEQQLRQRGWSYRMAQRGRVRRTAQYALVVTVGGDGTFLDTAHRVADVPMLGVNSAPSFSEGFYSAATAQTFGAVLDAWMAGRLPEVHLHRLQVRVDGVVLPSPVVNDVLLVHHSPAAVSRYRLQIGRVREEQRSSGVWVATAGGSTAGIRSAGGRVFPLESRDIQYMPRELYQGRHTPPYRLRGGSVGPRARVRFECLMDEARVFIDGPRWSQSVSYGNVIDVTADPVGLRVLGITSQRKKYRTRSIGV